MSTTFAVAAPRAREIARAEPRWGRLEWYIVVLMLSSGLLFVPGAEIVRPIIRGLPYALSLALLASHLSTRARRELPDAAKLVIPAVLLYAANLAHPLTEPLVGLATVFFHLSIVAPVFWAGAWLRDESHLEKLLWIVFGASLAQVVLAILQAAFPMVFMPPSISGDPGVLAQQTFMGPFGQLIIRPPGLTDLAGGASTSGTLTAVLGTAYLLRRGERPWVRMLGFGAIAAGMFVLYLTQVRAFAVMTVAALLLFVSIAFLQGRGRLIVVAAIGLALLFVLGGFLRFGYDPQAIYSPGTRYQEIIQNGVLNSWMEHRGRFFQQTLEEYVWQYPLGAGLGRWGMMREYFGSNTPFSMIWVEIQPTGWLIDAGVLMWVFYGGAILAALLASLRLAVRRDRGEVAYLAAIVLTIQCIIAGSGLAGPVFNTTFGTLFWVLTAVLYGAAHLGQGPVAAPAAARAGGRGAV